jgi:CDP-diacylglycerol--glycerol-3-phosphate 3-phosphatidyltransferase
MRRSRHVPNGITVLRFMLLVPFAVTLLAGRRQLYLAAMVIWICSAILDIIDGYAARLLGAETEFGAVIDLVTDRIMIATGVILVAIHGSANVYLSLVIVARELVVDSVRALRLKAGLLLPHNIFGQAKMAAIVGAVSSALAGLSILISPEIAQVLTNGLLVVALIAGALSLLRLLNPRLAFSEKTQRENVV